MKRLALYLPAPACLTTACLTAPKECVVNPSDPATETFAASLGVDLEHDDEDEIGDYTKTSSSALARTCSTRLQLVQIHYSAYLVDGTQVDRSGDRSPFPIDLSDGDDRAGGRDARA